MSMRRSPRGRGGKWRRGCAMFRHARATFYWSRAEDAAPLPRGRVGAACRRTGHRGAHERVWGHGAACASGRCPLAGTSSRIQYNYYTEDARALAALEDTVAGADARGTLARLLHRDS